MSSSYALRSDGSPYIAALSDVVANAVCPAFDTGSSYGALLLDLAVHALPVKKSSNDECHPLFSFFEYGPSGADVAYFGISPSGRLIGGSKAATTAFSTAAGTIVPDGRFRKIAYLFGKNDDQFAEWRFVAGSGSSWEYLNPLATRTYGGDSNDLDTLGVSASLNGLLMLFNGRLGLSRASVSIREAILAGTTAVPYWPMSDKAGTLVTADSRYNGVALPFSGALTMQQFYPPSVGVFSQPWGVPDGSDIYQHMRWALKTEYAREDQRHTIYARIAQ